LQVNRAEVNTLIRQNNVPIHIYLKRVVKVKFKTLEGNVDAVGMYAIIQFVHSP